MGDCQHCDGELAVDQGSADQAGSSRKQNRDRSAGLRREGIGRESRVEGNEEEGSHAEAWRRGGEESNLKTDQTLGTRNSTLVTSTPLSTPNRPLRVLFLGQVNLRKGIQYLIEAAGLVDPKKVVFDIVGSIQVADDKLAAAPTNVRFHGPVSRADAVSHYRNADVFVLPTISDGFAITQLEAMSHGLPVITTPNCGEVVIDSSDGFLVRARDPAALAGAFLSLADDRDRLRIMKSAALAKSRQFTGDRLAAALAALVQY